MKRKLSLFLAAVMTATMLPMSVFARTANTVDRVVSVDTGTYIGGAQGVDGVPKDADVLTQAPMLEMEAKNDWKGEQTFQVKVTNGKFRNDDSDRLMFEHQISIKPKWNGRTYDNDDIKAIYGNDGFEDNFTYRVISDTVVEITYNGNVKNGDFFYFPMHVKATDTGAITIDVDGRDSQFYSSTHTIANVGSGETKTTSVTKVISDKATELNEIVIDEVRIGSIDNSKLDGKYIELRAPSGFEFSLLGGSKEKVTGTGGLAGKVTTSGSFDLNSDKDILSIKINISGKSANQRGSIIIEGVAIRPLKNAATGDVNLRISGPSITRESFKVAEYKGYTISWEAEDKTLPVLVTGRFERNDSDDEEHETLKVTMKENVPDSWWSSRKTEITPPDGVEFIGFEILDYKNIEVGSGDKDKTPDWGKDYYECGYDGQNITVEPDLITFSDIKLSKDTNGAYKAAEIEMVFYLSVSISYTGDIDLTLGGNAVDEDQSTTVASTLTPITVETGKNDVKIGYKNIPVQDIIITENIAGAIQKRVYESGNKKSDATLNLWIADGLGFKDVANWEVTAGDIEIDTVEINTSDDSVNEGTINIFIKRESNKPSTIKLTGVTMDIDRTPPEGYYDLKVGGGAIIQNFTTSRTMASDYAMFGFNYSSKHAYIPVKDVFNVITAAPGSDNTWTTSCTITIGSDQIVSSDGRVTVMDSPAYIKDGRTMLPIRAVAVALGIADENVWWNKETRTASIRSANGGIVTVQTEDPNVYINGVAVFAMDTQPEIVNGRVFLPVAHLANALGVTYEWDATARTVTFNTEKETNLTINN